MFPYSRYKWVSPLVRYLGSYCFKDHFFFPQRLSNHLSSLASFRPFWDCKSNTFFSNTKYFLYFFLLWLHNYLIINEMIFGNFLSIFSFFLDFHPNFLSKKSKNTFYWANKTRISRNLSYKTTLLQYKKPNKSLKSNHNNTLYYI